MKKFHLVSNFVPTGDQPKAIKKLVSGIQFGIRDQVLLGVTGSGKTFTMANIIAKCNKPTLIISHNKTLAAQLYQEFKSFFPKNAVNYFVSYYDYYQPEAYIPTTDTYIDKETQINEEIDKLRLAATTNLLTRRDTLIVASVSCIYNIGSPKEYARFIIELRQGVKVTRESIFKRLVKLQYVRSNYGFHRGSFRVRGDNIDIFPAYTDNAIRLSHDGKKIVSINEFDPMTGKKSKKIMHHLVIYPAKHYMTDPRNKKEIFEIIRNDLKIQIKKFKKKGKLIEAQRINERVNFDLEMISEMGYVNGIENYSRYFDCRAPNEAPFTLLDYFINVCSKDWLLFIDESHMTIPQIRGMYAGDRSRKETLIGYGFRLPAALDNRPFRFDEFLQRTPSTIYVSATPNEWEITRAQMCARKLKSQSSNVKSEGVVEQLVRPTGLVDPKVSIRPVNGQIDDLISEIEVRVERKERTLVTILTKRMAEDLSRFLLARGIKVNYLHSDVETLKRSDILDSLRNGEFDVVVGINLLREGLDLPEVSLVAILDADKQGFLRSRTSLIQTMGRASRHIRGTVIMYADSVTRSMKEAIAEVARRRDIQLAYNKKHGIIPTTIVKPIREKLVEEEKKSKYSYSKGKGTSLDFSLIDTNNLTPYDRKKVIIHLTGQMKLASKDLNFELAAKLRDKIQELKVE